MWFQNRRSKWKKGDKKEEDEEGNSVEDGLAHIRSPISDSVSPSQPLVNARSPPHQIVTTASPSQQSPGTQQMSPQYTTTLTCLTKRETPDEHDGLPSVKRARLTQDVPVPYYQR